MAQEITHPSMLENQSTSELISQPPSQKEIAQEKRPRGRPKGTVKKHSIDEEHWATKMIRLYECGASDIEVCKELRISYNEFDSRKKSDTIFSQLVDFGRLASKSWWMELGRKGATGEKNFNYNAWYAVMKNRFGWSDRSEIVEGSEKNLDQQSKDELISEIAARKESLARLLGTSNVLLAQMNLTDEQPTGSD